MIQVYLLQYGFMMALALITASAILIFQARFKTPGFLIGISSLTMFMLKLMHEITFSQELITYNYDEQGLVLSANFEHTFWQNASLWVDPIGAIIMACGFLALSYKLRALNK